MRRTLSRSGPGAIVLALVALATVAAAGTAPVGTRLEAQSAPTQQSVRFVRAVAGAADWGITPGVFGRLINSLTGKEDPRFVRPTGVAVRDGVLYVADPGAPALWILDGPQSRVLKVTRAADSTLVSPVAVALGPEGSVFVADTVQKKIVRLDAAGNAIATIASPTLARPAAVAFDPERQWLYVADSVGHRIEVFGANGAPIHSFGSWGAADGEFNAPTHLAFDRGVLYVTDALNYRVQAFDRDGRFLWKMGRQGDGSGDFAAPKGVATDRAGNVYVVDALFDVVQVFDPTGALLVAFGEHGAGEGQLWLPGGLFIAGDEIYVADSYNRRIQVFRSPPPAGKGTTP